MVMKEINWIQITSPSDIEQIIERSKMQPQVIFKHSTRCGTSFLVKESLEEAEVNGPADFYLLDLIAYRDISNLIASAFLVDHASPQILVIKNGQCMYHRSHSAINMRSINRELTMSHPD